MASVLEQLRVDLGVRSGLFFAYDVRGLVSSPVVVLAADGPPDLALTGVKRFLVSAASRRIALFAEPRALGTARLVGGPASIAGDGGAGVEYERLIRARGVVSQAGLMLRDGSDPVGCVLVERLAVDPPFTGAQRRALVAGIDVIEAGFVLASRLIPIGDRTAHSAHVSLTERELDAVRLAADGATNQEIAQRLVVTVATVKTHLYSAYKKLEIGSRSELVARFGRRGAVASEGPDRESAA